MKCAKLADICSVSKGTQINGKELLETGYPFFNGGIKPSGYWSNFNLNENSITISEGGNSCGYVNYQAEKIWCGAHCYFLSDLKVNAKYLYYNLKHKEKDIMALRTGVCMPNIRKNDISSFPILVCDENKQFEIVKSLDQITNAINKDREELVKLDELVKSQFIEMFGDPVENKMQWKTDLLGNHVSVQGGYAFKSTNFKDRGIPVLRIGNINSGKFKPISMVYWDKDECLKNYEVYPGDLLMSLTGTAGKDDYGNICVMDKSYPLYYLNQRNAKLKINDSFNYLFVKELLAHRNVKSILIGVNHGVRQGNILNKDIQNLSVIVPPIELQNEFASFAEQIDKSKSIIQKRIDKNQELLDLKMHEYFGD